MGAMTARKGSETCTSAVSRIKSISGKRFRVMEFSHLIGLDTQLLYFKIPCLSLEAGMVMTQWMTSSSIVSSPTTGMRSTEQMDHLHSQDIGTQL